MVLAGSEFPKPASVEDVAEATLRVLKRNVPAAVPGIVFLSGGQSPRQATEHLNAMNAMGGSLPWKLSYSYGRALQAPSLEFWQGRQENSGRAQRLFYQRARLNSLAAQGRYSPDMEGEAV
jgi:fructose-bisphosphate aldolase class I